MSFGPEGSAFSPISGHHSHDRFHFQPHVSTALGHSARRVGTLTAYRTLSISHGNVTDPGVLGSMAGVRGVAFAYQITVIEPRRGQQVVFLGLDLVAPAVPAYSYNQQPPPKTHPHRHDCLDTML